MGKTKTYWDLYREREALHRKLEEDEARRADARDRCKGFTQKPCSKMTDREAMAFAAKQAEQAATSIRMTEEEVLQYASAVYLSIRYFNDRDKEHAAYMQYLDKCKKAAAEAAKSEAERVSRKPIKVYLY